MREDFLTNFVSFKLAIHDARSGFHDIKPLPEFSPLNHWLILTPILLAALALLAWLIHRWSKREKPLAPPVPAAQRALQAIADLNQKRQNYQVSIRDFGTELSLILRGYLEEELLFPARELTVRECMTQLPTNLRNKLPRLANGSFDKFLAETGELLAFCEFVTFSDVSEEQVSLDNARIDSASDNAGELIRSLEIEINLELERTLAEERHAA